MSSAGLFWRQLERSSSQGDIDVLAPSCLAQDHSCPVQPPECAADYGFNGDGIRINNPAGSAGCTVRACYIGTDTTGTAENLGNTGSGITIYGADNVIGSAVPDWLDWGSRNVISGNGQDGIVILGEGANRNLVANNFIGVKRDGQTPLSNKAGSGVIIVNGANNNTIGGSAALAMGPVNVISGNGSLGFRHGVEISSAYGNKVFGNYIGLGWDGSTVVGNTASGVALSNGATGNVIGQAGGYGNVISGNQENGVYLFDEGTAGNTVAANYIGTDWLGTTAKGNTLDGVRIDGAPHNTIGGSSLGAGNVISGNGQNGVHVTGATARENYIWGNRIGTNAWGTTALANSDCGFRISD